MSNRDVIRDFDFHPDEPHVRVFSCVPSTVLRWDDRVFVCESLFGDIVLRHYAFEDEWFKINVTTDRAGRIVETPPSTDAPAFAFNCDIATPMRREGNDVYAVDLFADVLVGDDGTTFEIVDFVKFDQAASKGSISPKEFRHGKAGLARLTELIDRSELISFLAGVCPFGESSAQSALPMSLVPVQEVPLVQPRRRPSW